MLVASLVGASRPGILTMAPPLLRLLPPADTPPSAPPSAHASGEEPSTPAATASSQSDPSGGSGSGSSETEPLAGGEERLESAPLLGAGPGQLAPGLRRRQGREGADAL